MAACAPWAADRRGTAAVEFAICSGLILTLLLGVTDLLFTGLARFKVGHAATSLADIAGVATALQTTDMTNVLGVTPDVLSPLPTSKLSYRLTNVASNGAGKAFVYWSCTVGSAYSPFTALSQMTTTPGGVPVGNLLRLTNGTAGSYVLQGTNTSFLMVEVNYPYTPPVSFISASPRVMTTIVYASPRASDYVGFPWSGSATSQPTAPASATKVGTVTPPSSSATCSYGY